MSDPNGIMRVGLMSTSNDLMCTAPPVRTVSEAYKSYWQAYIDELNARYKADAARALLDSSRYDQARTAYDEKPGLSEEIERLKGGNVSSALNIRGVIACINEAGKPYREHTANLHRATTAWSVASQKLGLAESFLTGAVRAALSEAGVSNEVIEATHIEPATLDAGSPIVVVSTRKGDPFVALVNSDSGKVELLHPSNEA